MNWKKECSICHIVFNPHTSPECPVCSQKLILSKHQSKYLKKETIIRKYKSFLPRPYSETYQPTGIVAKTKKKYQKLYQKLPRILEYKKMWARQKRQRIRESVDN